MKFLRKGIWPVVIATVVIGLVLMIAGVVLGASLGVYIDNRGTHIADSSETIISEPNLGRLTDLDIDTGFSDIEFVKSDSYGLEIIYYSDSDYPEWSVENGRLKIVQGGRSFFSSYRLNFGFVSFNRNVIKVYLPDEAELDNVLLKTSSGNIRVSGFNAGYTEIHNSFGNVDVRDVSCGAFRIFLDSGDFTADSVYADNVTVKNKFGDTLFSALNTDELSSEISSGNFTIKNSRTGALTIKNNFGNVTAENLVSGSTNITSDSGDTDVSGEFSGKTEIFSKFGNVTLATSASKELYSFDISARFGKLNFDNERYSDNSYVKSAYVLEDDIKISASSGDIKVIFGK